MRIISGLAKGKKIKTIKGQHVRPTLDHVREALFNMLQEHVQGAFVLDLYAGSGAFGLEALSRGAAKACFVEYDSEVMQLIKENLFALGFFDKAEVYCKKSLMAIKELAKKKRRFDLIFLDPPYKDVDTNEIFEIFNKNLLTKDGIIILEHSSKMKVPQTIAELVCITQKKYGQTMLTVYKGSG